jgi:hypothetical protein
MSWINAYFTNMTNKEVMELLNFGTYAIGENVCNL